MGHKRISRGQNEEKAAIHIAITCFKRAATSFSFILITGPPAVHREGPGHHIVEMRFHLGSLGLQVSICRSREWFDTTQGYSRQLQ